MVNNSICYIIQSKLYKDSDYQQMNDTLTKYGMDHIYVRISPFSNNIVLESDIPNEFNDFDELPFVNLDLTKYDILYFFGSHKLGELLKLHFSNLYVIENFVFNNEYCIDFFGDKMLNYDSDIYSLNDSIEWKSDKLFIRPITSDKVFSGSVFTREKWENTKEMYLNNSYYSSFNTDLKIQVAPIKKIEKEARFWVIDKSIVGNTGYAKNNQFELFSWREIDNSARSFIRENLFVKIAYVYDFLYPLNILPPIFSVDLGLINNKWKIIEFHQLNTTGFYSVNISDIIRSLDYYLKNIKTF